MAVINYSNNEGPNTVFARHSTPSNKGPNTVLPDTAHQTPIFTTGEDLHAVHVGFRYSIVYRFVN